MGIILGRIYDGITHKMGFSGRMRLAARTGVQRNEALAIPDTEEMVQMFRTAAWEILDGSFDEAEPKESS